MENIMEDFEVVFAQKTIRQINQNLYSNLPDIQGSAYDKKAKLYEKLVSLNAYNKIVWGTLPQDYIDFAKVSINGCQDEGIGIDIGCGGLIQTANIYATTKLNYILLDHSIEMLKIASQRLINLSGKIPNNIKLLQANAFHLPFDNNSFDNLVSFGMIHCFENKIDFINESMRVLKPGGRFYFTSMISDRLIGRIYMNMLRKQKEFGKPCSSEEILTFFRNFKKLDYYIKGNMIFIKGVK